MAKVKRMGLMKNPVEKNPAAVALGRLGGKAPKSKPYGFAAISKKRVRQISAQGVAARKRSKLKRAS